VERGADRHRRRGVTRRLAIRERERERERERDGVGGPGGI